MAFRGTESPKDMLTDMNLDLLEFNIPGHDRQSKALHQVGVPYAWRSCGADEVQHSQVEVQHACECKSGARPLKGELFDTKLYEPGEGKVCTHDKQSLLLNE